MARLTARPASPWMSRDVRRPSAMKARWLWWAALTVIVLVGLVGRAWNLDFDHGQHQHPDERYWAIVSDAMAREEPVSGHGTILAPVVNWLDADTSAANPYRVVETFPYGPITLAMSRDTAEWLRAGVDEGSQPALAVAKTLDAVGVPLINDDGVAEFDDGYQVELVGRLLSALIDTLTIVVVALIARSLAGRSAGLVGAALYAASPLALQHAHFLGSEPLVAFACGLTVLASLHLDRGASARRAAATGTIVGIAGGLAVAAKLSGVSVAVVPVFGALALVTMHRRRSDVVRVAAMSVAMFVSFRVFNPGAFAGLGVFPSDAYRADLERVRTQFDADSPPSIQWAGRSGAGQAVEWLVRFTVGPGLSILAAIGASVLVRQLWISRPGASPASNVGRWNAAIPLAACLVPFAYVLIAALPSGRYFMPMLPTLSALAGVGAAATWHRAAQIEAADRERRRRSVGMRCGVAALVGLGVLWGVMFVHGIYGQEYTRIDATRWIAANVPPGSVITSQAWDDGLPLHIEGVDPAAYTSVQFNMVGTDHVDKVVQVVRQLQDVDFIVEASPRLWGSVQRIPARFPSTIAFFDALDSGDLGFERVATFDRDPSLGPLRLDDGGAEEAFSVYDHPEVRIWQKVDDVAPAAMLDVLDPRAAGRALTVLAAESGADGLRLTEAERAELRATGTFDEQFGGGPGWLHAIGWLLVIELLAAAVFVVLLPRFHGLPDAGLGVSKTLGLMLATCSVFVANTWLGIRVGTALVAAIVVSASAVGVWATKRRRVLLKRVWHSHRRVMIVVQAVCVFAFGAVLALRAANPDLWHPSRSGEKPFEQMVLTSVLRSNNLPPFDAWFAGGVSNYYYGGYLLLSVPARLMRTAPQIAMNIGVAVFAMCAAGAAATLCGALVSGGAARRVSARQGVAAVVAGGVALAAANVAAVREGWRHVRSDSIYDWWGVSRVVPNSNDITEFPAWTFLFGDLHPHLMGMCLLLAGCTVAVVTYRGLVDESSNSHPDRRMNTAWGWVGWGVLGGLLLGTVRATNTWDLPLAAGLLASSVGLAAIVTRRRADPDWWRLPSYVLVGIVAGWIAWLPYAQRGLVFDSGAQRATIHTPWVSWFNQFGWFAAVALLAVLPGVRRAIRNTPPAWRGLRIGVLNASGVALVTVGVVMIWPDAAVFVTVTLLAGATGAIAWISRRETQSGRTALALAAHSVAWTVQAGVEAITIRNDIGRQNTVFKFWNQSWLLLAVASAALLVLWLGDRTLPRTRRVMSAMLGGLAIGMAAVFIVFGVPIRLDDRVSVSGWSLNGEEYLTAPGPRETAATTGYQDQTILPADDLALIEWVRANVEGGRIVAEASGDDYLWTGRISALTGTQSPVGWRFHEVQQRRPYGPEVDKRYADFQTLYSTTDPIEVARILATYEADYVAFGTVEAVLAGPNAAVRDDECLTVVFESDAAWLASVDQDCAWQRWRAALVETISQPEDGE